MSVATMVHIYCDGCGETYGVDNSAYYNARQHRWEAEREGWVNIGKKDYCPNCKGKQLNKQSKEEQ